MNTVLNCEDTQVPASHGYRAGVCKLFSGHMQPLSHLLAASRPLAERGVLWPVGRRLMAAAVLLVAQLLSVYTVTLLGDACH